MKYGASSAIEAYLDAELLEGAAISWILEVEWTPELWTIDASVQRSSIGGQKTIRQFPPQAVEGFEIFLDSLFTNATNLLSDESVLDEFDKSSAPRI